MRAGAVKEGYEQGARRLAARSITGLARTRVTPNALTAAGVFLCCVAAVLVYFEHRGEILFFWLGGVVFLVGSILDVMDGALARHSGRGTDFGAFIDSTTDRVGEAAVLGAVVLVLMRDGDEIGVGLTVAGLAGGMLVPYARARAEALGLKGEVGYGGRGERVAIITAALVLAPWGLLPWGMGLLNMAIFARPSNAPLVHFPDAFGSSCAQQRGQTLVTEPASGGNCVCEMILPMIRDLLTECDRDSHLGHDSGPASTDKAPVCKYDRGA